MTVSGEGAGAHEAQGLRGRAAVLWSVRHGVKGVGPGAVRAVRARARGIGIEQVGKWAPLVGIDELVGKVRLVDEMRYVEVGIVWRRWSGHFFVEGDRAAGQIIRGVGLMQRGLGSLAG